jgi:hypothetical protein
LYNKANELQEDISMKRFDLRVAQIHLAAVRAQVSTHTILFLMMDDDLLIGSIGQIGRFRVVLWRRESVMYRIHC